MIKTLLISSGAVLGGGVELIARWQADPASTIWVDLSESTDLEDAQIQIKNFKLHPLAIEDALRERHPAKIEGFEEFTFLLLKGLGPDSTTIDFKTVQLSMFVGKDFLLTYHNHQSLSIERLYTELTSQASYVPKSASLLVLRLCRYISQRYINILLDLEPRLEELEELMLEDANDDMLSELIRYKSDLKRLQRVADYHEQVFQQLKSRVYPGIDESDQHEIIDVWEKLERTKSLSRLFYETSTDLIEGYISVASHKLNQIMKVLTIVMAIFVPLSFLAGIYGMNFENIPELHHPSGYFLLLTVMGSIAGFLLFLFRKMKWL